MPNLCRKLRGSSLLLKTVILLMLFYYPSLEAQSVPADLLDLSIEELFKAEISDDLKTDEEKSRRWHLNLRYQKSEFEQYRKGTQKLSVDDVLFSPGQEQRTIDNFPVVPTKINQQVVAIIFGYDFSNRTTVSATVPFVRQINNFPFPCSWDPELLIFHSLLLICAIEKKSIGAGSWSAKFAWAKMIAIIVWVNLL